MAASLRWRIARRLPRFQFTLRHMFALTTVLALGFGLARWNLGVGMVVLILTIGCWWTAAAMSAYWYRTAYLFGAFTSGLMVYGAALLPLSPLYFVFCRGDGPLSEPLPNPTAIVLCCISTALAAAVVRPWLVRTPGHFPIVWSLVAVYLAAAVWVALVFALSLLGLLGPRPEWDDFARALGGALVAALAATTLSLHVLLPTMLILLVVLEDVQTLALDFARTEKRILEVVELLLVLDAGPIFAEQVARRVCCDRRTTEALLERLVQSGQLEFTQQTGYRRAFAHGSR